MIRYECQNCEKKFELAEATELRCPFCFWTTSVRPVGETRETSPRENKPADSKSTVRINPKIIGIFLFVVILGVVSVFFIKSGAIQQTGTFIREKFSSPKPKVEISKPNEKSVKTSKPESPVLLSEEDQSVLNAKVLFEIPHKLSDEEKEILNRKVDLNIAIQETGDLKFWTVDDFKKFLSDQQARRKIFFSWGYEKSLFDLFKTHYLKAQTLFASGEAEAARVELFATLVIPRYSEDLRIHRGVGLVMLKDFIDDTVQKIKVLNSYTVRHEMILRANQLKEDYDQFFVLVNGEKWDEALAFADRLQESAKNLDSQTKQIDVQYPPVFAQIDPDIKASLNVPAEDLTSVSSNVNSFLADLRIKRNAIEANTPKFLETTKSQYESALKAIEEKRWSEARQALESISYPPEVVQDAKHKAAIITKILPPTEST